MASHAPIMGAPTCAPDFRINGSTPFLHETALEYVQAAHAVASFAHVAAVEHETLYPADGLTVGTFNAIALLLSHAARVLEAREGR